MLNTQTQLQYHTWEHLKVGRLERVGEEEHREGQKQLLQMQSVTTMPLRSAVARKVAG